MSKQDKVQCPFCEEEFDNDEELATHIAEECPDDPDLDDEGSNDDEAEDDDRGR